MFVVSLGPNTVSARSAAGVRAFITPTVFFFTTVLVVAALMTMPAMSANLLAGVFTLGSLGGLIYMITVILLLVIGIRNAWELVLWMAQQSRG